jgi:hypothetical protein
MSYGKHQSFYLKSHWINKGIKALDSYGSSVLFDKEMYRKLGIGKNMHQALRYWMEATCIVNYNLIKREHRTSKIGKTIEKFDPGCSLPLTKLILHYNLIRDYGENRDTAETFSWFFTKTDALSYSKDKIKDDLLKFNKNRTSERTLYKDIDCLLSTYVEKELKHAEDKNISIFHDLGLIRKFDNIYVKSSLSKDMYDYGFFMYVLINMQTSGVNLTFDEILNHQLGLGKTLNLNRSEIITILEKLTTIYDMSITRTNNLNTVILYFEIIDTYDFVKEIYTRGSTYVKN